MRQFIVLTLATLITAAVVTQAQETPKKPIGVDFKPSGEKPKTDKVFSGATPKLKAEIKAKSKAFEDVRKQLLDFRLKQNTLRVKLIKDDPELGHLKREIMRLHRKMALIMEKNPDMKRYNLECDKLSEKLKSLNREIATLKARAMIKVQGEAPKDDDK